MARLRDVPNLPPPPDSEGFGFEESIWRQKLYDALRGLTFGAPGVTTTININVVGSAGATGADGLGIGAVQPELVLYGGPTGQVEQATPFKYESALNRMTVPHLFLGPPDPKQTLPPLQIQAATLIGVEMAGAVEYDAAYFYGTDDLLVRRPFLQGAAGFPLGPIGPFSAGQVVFGALDGLGGLQQSSGFIVTSTSRVGIGSATPLALLHVGAGSATLAPFRLTSNATLASFPASGAWEYDDARAMFHTLNSVRYATLGTSSVPGVNGVIYATAVREAAVATTAAGTTGTVLGGNTGLPPSFQTFAAAGLVSGSGAATRVTVWDSASTVTGYAGFLYVDTAHALAITGSYTDPAGVLVTTSNTSTATRSISGFAAQANNGTVTVIASLYADGLGTSVVGAASGLVGTSSNHPLAFLTNGAEVGRWTTGGKLGINRTSPDAYLHVHAASPTAILSQGSTTGVADLRVLNSLVDLSRGLSLAYSGTAYASPLLTSGPTGESGALTTTGAYPLSLGTGGTAAMTISTGQVVLVGQATVPTSNGLLDVYGSIVARDSTAGLVRMQLSATAATAGAVGTTSNHKVQFVSNNTVQMTLDATGHFGIGVAPSGAWLHLVGGTASEGPLKFTSDALSPSADGVMYYHTSKGPKFVVGTTPYYFAIAPALLPTNGVVYGTGTLEGTVAGTAQGAAYSILTANAGVPAFSQSPQINTSLTIGVVSSVSGHLFLYNASSTKYTSIQSGIALNDVNYTLPTDAPASNGYGLTCTTAGVMSWSALAAGTITGTGSNHGVAFWTSASALSYVTVTATANQMLVSGASADPAWSTTTWPLTLASTYVLYATGTNTIGGAATFTHDGAGNVVLAPVSTGAAGTTIYSYGTSGVTNTPSWAFRASRGTVASPSASQSGDRLGAIAIASPWTTTSTWTNTGSIDSYAAENIDSTHGGTYLTLSTTPLASVTKAERLRISAAGVAGIGDGANSTARLGQLLSMAASATYGGLSSTVWSAAAADDSSIIEMNRSRSSTIGTHTIVQNNDTIGYIQFRGSNGSTFDPAAAIRARVGGTPGASADMPGKLEFMVTPDGSATLAVVMTIFSTGGVNLGSPTGGDKGAGTFNTAGDQYKNGTAYTNPAWVFQVAYRGWGDQTGKHAMDPGYEGLMTLEATEAYARKHFELPTMDLRPDGGIFDRGDLVLASVEEAYLHIFSLNERIKKLEGRLAQ